MSWVWLSRALVVLGRLEGLGLADIHADLAWLHFFGLGDLQPQHTIGQVGLDGVGLDGSRQADRALERAKAPLDPVEVALLAVGLLASLALDREHIVLDSDL